MVGPIQRHKGEKELPRQGENEPCEKNTMTMTKENNIEISEKEIQQRAELLIRNEVFLNVGDFVEASLLADAHGVKNQPITEADLFDNPNFKEDEDGNFPDIFEWWAVSNSLADDLRERGEIIIETGFHSIWGRQTTGQSLALDYVIHEIAKKMIADYRTLVAKHS